MSTAQLTLGDIALDITFKDIKNVHLSVHPPLGNVSISAPERMTLETIRAFAITKIAWIRKQRRKFQLAERAFQHEYLNRESHFLWGTRLLLRIEETQGPPSVDVGAKYLTLRISPSADIASREALLSKWYRERIHAEVPLMVERCSKALGVGKPRVNVRKMKTKWGSCNHKTGSILLNTELAKMPKDCIEYVLLHEMAHLIEPTHNANFSKIMNRVMPAWQARRDLLNALPAPTT